VVKNDVLGKSQLPKV